MPAKPSIRLLSDIDPVDVLAELVAAVRVDEFQVTVHRSVGGIEVGVYRNGLPFHVKSIVVDEIGQAVMNFVEGE